MTKVALVDLHCPAGHLNLINFYADKLKKEFDYIILNKEIKKFITNKNINFVSYPHKKNILFRFFYALKVCNYLISKNIKKIFFLSYDPKFFFFISFYLKFNKINIFLIEHDALNKKKKIKFFLNKLICSSVVRLVYNKNKFSFVKKFFFSPCYIINHPIIKDYKTLKKFYKNSAININGLKKNFKGVILIPTRFNINFFNLYSFIKKNNDFLFIVLSKKIKIFKNIIFIDNIRENIIKKVDAIYLPINDFVYRYRLSSWIYKGISYNKKIFLDNESTFKFEKKRFNSFIFDSNENLQKIIKKKININKNFISNYNLKVIIDFKYLINNKKLERWPSG
jgi:hypothetical protein